MTRHTPEPELSELRTEYDMLKVQSPELIKLFDDVAGSSGPHPQAGPRGTRPTRHTVSRTPEHTALLTELDALKAESPELIKLFEDVAATGRHHAQAAQRGARR